MNIKDIVANGARVEFTRYFDSQLWYRTDSGFEFPVPVADIGSATFYAEDKAILFMRWIRKHMGVLEKARREQEAGA